MVWVSPTLLKLWKKSCNARNKRVPYYTGGILPKKKTVHDESLLPERGGFYYDRSTFQKVRVKCADKRDVICILVGGGTNGDTIPIPIHNFWRDFSPEQGKPKSKQTKPYRSSRKYMRKVSRNRCPRQ